MDFPNSWATPKVSHTEADWWVGTFYGFARVADPEAVKANMVSTIGKDPVYGTILVAEEGANGTLCAPARAMLDETLGRLSAQIGLHAGFDPTWSRVDRPIFHKLKVQVKKEIVTFKTPEATPLEGEGGTHLGPDDWNELISDPDTIIIDTRNSFETKVGTFPRANDPGNVSFSQFPAFVEEQLRGQEGKKVAMFCTGGIRCEKASVYMKAQGFDQVFQLKGGILRYFQETTAETNLWDGDCYVFDDRVALDRNLEPGGHISCPVCRMPVRPDQFDDPRFKAGYSCPNCADDPSFDRTRASSVERLKQILLAAKKGKRHLGPQD